MTVFTAPAASAFNVKALLNDILDEDLVDGLSRRDTVSAVCDGVEEACHLNAKWVACIGLAGLCCPVPGLRGLLLQSTATGAAMTAAMYVGAKGVKYAISK